MNPPKNQDQIIVQLNGQISLSRDGFKMLLAEFLPKNSPPELSQGINMPEKMEIKKRLAYSMSETAEILGISYISVHRLVKRGLLKNSKALRKIIIPALKIKRFLRETL